MGYPEVAQPLEEILSKTTNFDNYEIEHDLTLLSHLKRFLLKTMGGRWVHYLRTFRFFLDKINACFHDKQAYVDTLD